MNYDWVNKKLAKRNLKKRKFRFVKAKHMPITRYMTKKEATWFLEDIGWFRPSPREEVVPKDTIPQFGILVVE